MSFSLFHYEFEFMLRMSLDAVSSVTPQVTPQASPQVQQLLAALRGEMSREQLQHTVGLKDRKSFRKCYIAPALAAGLIEMTLPDTPNSPLQKYRLTETGRRWLMDYNDK